MSVINSRVSARGKNETLLFSKQSFVLPKTRTGFSENLYGFQVKRIQLLGKTCTGFESKHIRFLGRDGNKGLSL